jgi:uncharacterized protein YbbC (DUF1343 family)
LRSAKVPGIKAVPLFFTPTADRYQGTRCGGVSLTITNSEELNSVLFGISLVSILRKLYPNEFEMGEVLDLLGNAEAMRNLREGKSPAEILRAGSTRMRQFLAKRQKALIYDGTPRRKKERQ